MLDYNNGQNYVANSLKSEYGEDFANIIIDSAIMGTGNFSTSSPKARRAVVEDAMAIIVLHSYAITAMYTGIDNCNEGKPDTYWWDDAVASLVGWAEGTESGGSNSNGFLFYEFAQNLCTDVDLCNIGDDSEVNRLLMLALTDGKQNLLDLDCSSADEDLAEVELLIETVLVDLLAYYVEQIDKKPSDEESLAHGYIVATALVPLMRKVSSAEADTVKIFVDEVSYGYGNCKDEVFEALNAFVSARGINCDMLTRNICAGDSNAETTDGDTSMSTTTPAIIGNDVGQNEEGIPSGSNGVQSSSLLSGAYSPTSNVDHVIKLTELLDAIEKSGTTEEGLSFYTQLEGGVSLQSLSTGSQLDYVKRINPIYIIYMYGLWISDDGDNDSNSYSGKVFDDEDLANFGDTIVRDEFGKASGYDPLLTAETIRVVNMWMAMTTELYKAVASCRDGSSSGANPVDFAAALWFGNHQNAEASEGARHVSLFYCCL